MADMTEPTFVVGTTMEAGAINGMRYRAVTLEDDLDGLALKLEQTGSTAIIMLEDMAAEAFADVCDMAGTTYRIVPAAMFRLAVNDYFRARDIGTDTWTTQLYRICTEERQQAIEAMEADKLEADRRLLAKLGVHDVADVAIELVGGTADRERIPTGLKNLDAILGGGLPMGGLVTLGAVSSTGKTTLCLQIADHIAASGRPVLFVTVEQGRHELVAKSISRIVRCQPTRNGGWYTISSAEIRSAKARAEWGEPLAKAFSSSCISYAQTIAPNMMILETDKQPSTKDIRRAAEAIERQQGTAPLVFVDYLQLLEPASDRMTERQAIDHNVMDLRHLARDTGTCVVAISSLNRASYGEGVTLEAFKESGAIEYGSDVLLGLQPYGMEDKLRGTKTDEQRRKARDLMGEYKGRSTRDTEVKVLKNREGAVPRDGAHLVYHAISNLFEDGSGHDQTDSSRRPRV